MDKVKEIKSRFNKRLYDSQLYAEFLKFHETDVGELLEIVKQQQLDETLLLDRIKRDTLQIKEMKKNSRLTRFWDLAEENLILAQEIARLKGEVPV
jgi:hypothetical protein